MKKFYALSVGIAIVSGCITSGKSGKTEKPFHADAGQDTSVTLKDTVWLRSRAGGATKVEWDIGGLGRFAPVSGDTAVISGSDVGIEIHVLRVTNSGGESALDTLVVRVRNDRPKITGLKDSLDDSARERLMVTATDAGRIVKWEWDLGNGVFVPGPKDTSFLPVGKSGDSILYRVRVTDDDGNATTDSDYFEIGRWKIVGSAKELAAPLGSHYAAFASEGKLHVIGFKVGEKSYAQYQRIHLAYDTAMKTWSQDIPLPGLVKGFSIVEMAGKRYCIGGRDVGDAVGQGRVYYYEPKLREWESLGDLPEGVASGRATGLDGTIYYAGVSTGFDHSTPFWEYRFAGALKVLAYNPADDSWQTVAQPILGDAYWKVLAVTAGDRALYILMGSATGQTTKMVEVDPKLGTSKFFDPPGEVFGEAGMAIAPSFRTPKTLSDQVVVLWGREGEGTPSQARSVRIYDSAKKLWSQESRTLHDHRRALPVEIGGKIWNLTDDNLIESYDPEEDFK